MSLLTRNLLYAAREQTAAEFYLIFKAFDAADGEVLRNKEWRFLVKTDGTIGETADNKIPLPCRSVGFTAWSVRASDGSVPDNSGFALEYGDGSDIALADLIIAGVEMGDTLQAYVDQKIAEIPGGAAGAVDSVNTKTGAVVINADDIGTTGTTNKFVTTAEKSTWNAKQDALGYTPVPATRTVNGKALSANITIAPSDLTEDATHRFATDAEKTTWNAKQNALGYTAENAANKSTDVSADQASTTKYSTVKALYDWAVALFVPATRTINSLDLSANRTLTQDTIGDGTTYKQYSGADKTKLAGIAASATANSSDATLLARANHTGTQLAATVSDFNTAALAAAPAETTATIKTALGITVLSGSNTGDETTATIKTALGITVLSGSNTGDETAARIGPLIAGSTVKATPINADSFIIADSAASNAGKNLSFTNLKAFLKTYFDTLYQAVLTLGTGVATFLTTPSSANFAAALTDEIGTGKVLFSDPVINAQTGTTYTLLATDNGKIVEFNNASAITCTVPVSLGTGFNCIISTIGAGQVTLTPSSTTLRNRSGLKTAGQYAVVSIVPTSTANVFIVSGDCTV